MQQQTPFMQVFFCNPGEYKVNLSLNIQYNSAAVQYCPNIGMPQQQLPALQYGDANARRFGNNGCAPFGNNTNTFCLPRQNSSSSVLESSYSSGLSTPGIASESWSYNSPYEIYPDNTREQFNNARWNGSDIHSCSFNSVDTNAFNPTKKSSQYPTTSTPQKGGCFSVKNCTII